MELPKTTRGGYSILPRHGACLRCRKRKQKCDAIKPECRECITANQECQYEDVVYKTRTQLLQDKIKELETQISAIEEKQNAAPLLSVVTLHEYSRGSQSQSPGLSSSSSGSMLWSDESRSPTVSSPSSVFSGPTPPFSPKPDQLGGNFSRSNQSWPSLEITERLMNIFFLRCNQCGFELHVGRVMQSLRPNAAEPIIPALFSAMLLLACHFAQDQKLQAWETTFLEHTKLEIETNIAHAYGGEDNYNPLYHLQAMLLHGIYYFFKGRLLEGHFHTSQATRFAMTLNFHHLNSRIFHRDGTVDEVELGMRHWRPRDSTELGETINLWWSCFCWDMGGSTLNGLPPSISFEEVTTVWPRLLSDFESGYSLPDDTYSIPSLFDLGLSNTIADISGDNLKTLVAKSFVLMKSASNIDLARAFDPRGTEEWWSLFERCDQSLNLSRQTMPPIHLARSLEELTCLVFIHTAIYCGEIQLHCTLAEYELAQGAQGDPRYIRPDGSIGGLSYDRCSEACRAVVLAASIVENIDMSYLHMFMGICWVCVSEAVAVELRWVRQNGQAELAKEKEQLWEVVERCMEKLLITYPLLRLQLEQLRLKKREHRFP